MNERKETETALTGRIVRVNGSKGPANVHARTPVCTCVASLSQPYPNTRITLLAVSANKLYDIKRPLLQSSHRLGRRALFPTASTSVRTKEIARAPGVDPLGQIHRTGAGAVLLLAMGKMLERHIIDVELALAGDAEYWASGDLKTRCCSCTSLFPRSGIGSRLLMSRRQ
jgi:hypothetical protein